jgi:hypothetical protein
MEFEYDYIPDQTIPKYTESLLQQSQEAESDLESNTSTARSTSLRNNFPGDDSGQETSAGDKQGCEPRARRNEEEENLLVV